MLDLASHSTCKAAASAQHYNATVLCPASVISTHGHCNVLSLCYVEPCLCMCVYTYPCSCLYTCSYTCLYSTRACTMHMPTRMSVPMCSTRAMHLCGERLLRVHTRQPARNTKMQKYGLMRACMCVCVRARTCGSVWLCSTSLSMSCRLMPCNSCYGCMYV